MVGADHAALGGQMLAQGTTPGVCGPSGEQDWLCLRTLDATGNEVLAHAATWLGNVLTIVTVLLVAFVLVRLVGRAILRFSRRMEGAIEQRLDRAVARGALPESQRYRVRRLQRLQAITGVLRGVVGVAVWLTALLVVVGLLGIPLQPILAGAGLAGIVLGFGAQQLVRDVLAGIAMLIEDQYGVGDWIEVNGKFGQVEQVGLRSTAFRDVDGVVHHVLNGSIEHVGNLSQEWARATLDVPIALDADIPTTKALIHRIATDLVDDEVWGEDIIGPPEIWGVQAFGPEGVVIRVVIPTKPLRNWDVMRQLRERLKLAFDQSRIRMPSQFVEVGGQRNGYPLLTSDTADPGTQPAVSDHVADDGEPPDAPPRGGPIRQAGIVDRTGDTDRHEPVPHERGLAVDDDRDVTRALRIERGPEARPD